MCQKCDQFATDLAQQIYIGIIETYTCQGIPPENLPARLMQITATLYRIMERFCIEADDNSTPEAFRKLFDGYIAYVAQTATITVRDIQDKV